MRNNSYTGGAIVPCSTSTLRCRVDVAPEVNRLEGAFVYDIDDLQSVTASHMSDRSREAMQAEAIVQAEVERRFRHRPADVERGPGDRVAAAVHGGSAAGRIAAHAGQAAVAFGGATKCRRGVDARVDQQGAAPATAGDEGRGAQRRSDCSGGGAAGYLACPRRSEEKLRQVRVQSLLRPSKRAMQAGLLRQPGVDPHRLTWLAACALAGEPHCSAATRAGT